ncbi:MAG TPA: RHS repeat-associated core domain-containing protein [Polyangiaceae bacterium]
MSSLENYVPAAAGLPSFVTHYGYDLDHKLVSESRPDATIVSRGYDSAGRVTDVTMPTGTLEYTYYPAGCSTTGCAAGRLESILGPSAQSLSFTYDGRLHKGSLWSGLVNGSVSWSYDADFRKVSESIQAGANTVSAAFGYDADSLLTCASPTTCPSGAGALTISRNSQNTLLTGTSSGSVTDTYGYNTYGELATYTAKYGTNALYALTYDASTAPRDALGRVVQKTETLQGATHTFNYAYNTDGRLTEVRRDGTLTELYDYDPNGNRTSATVDGTSVAASYDDQDRLLTYGSTTYTYTANGELHTKTNTEGTTTYTYDAMGSLIAVQLPDGRLIEYVTDGQNRRIAKRVNGAVIRQWLYRDQLKPVAELDGAGNLVAQFIYGTKSNIPDLIVRGGSTYRIISDQLGSPVLAVNTANSGDIPFKATYATFGERSVTSGTASEDWMPFGFAGGLYDADTKLTRFGARDYDAVTGRWISKDPIVFKGEQANLYVYAKNDPVNLLDANGKLPTRKCVKRIIKGCEEGAHGVCAPLAFATCTAIALAEETFGDGGYCDEPEVDCASAAEDCTMVECGHLLGRNSFSRSGGSNTQFGFAECYQTCMSRKGC